MAVLTDDQKAEIRKAVSQSGVPVNYIKTQIGLAMQAVEDLFDNSARTALGNAIETAVPGVFTPAQKKQIVKYWLFSKFGRE